jgi:hypothetical protein
VSRNSAASGSSSRNISIIPGWTYHDRPLHADVVTLRDILFRKYQRRRASAEDVASIDEMLRLYVEEE